MHRADRIRNVALVGHRGSGKTSVNEALLFQADAVNRLGTVLDGNTASDSDPDEQARQMSISASLSSFEWDDRKINLIDTPGEPSFVADALGALRCESAVFVINAVMGAESTIRLWQRARSSASRGCSRQYARPRAPTSSHPGSLRAFGHTSSPPDRLRARVRSVVDLDMKA
jgi:translation elongation factor EF-G